MPPGISQHEGQVHVLETITHVDVSVLWSRGHVEEGQAQPEQTAQHHNAAAFLKLQAPGP